MFSSTQGLAPVSLKHHGILLHIKHAVSSSPVCTVTIPDVSMTVLSLKKLLEGLSSTPATHQQLLTENGQALQDMQTLSGIDAGLGEASLFLVNLPAQPGELIDAIRSDGTDSLVRYLLKAAGEINGVDRSGRTALHFAVEAKRADLCRQLLEHEGFTCVDAIAGPSSTAFQEAREAAFAQRNWGLEDVDGPIGTVLQVAIENECLEICKILLESNRFSAVNEKCWFIYGRCYAMDAYISSEATVLHLAACRGHAQICSLLLGSPRFTEVNARDSVGSSALHLAVSMLHEDICSVLLADPRVDADVNDNVGTTPFDVGILCARDSPTHLLSDFGCDKSVCRRKAVGVCEVFIECDRWQPSHGRQAARDSILKALQDIKHSELTGLDQPRTWVDDVDSVCDAEDSELNEKHLRAEQRARSRRQEAKRRNDQEKAVERQRHYERRHGPLHRDQKKVDGGQLKARGARQKKANAGRAVLNMAFNF